MTARRDPDRVELPDLMARVQDFIEERQVRTAHDTVADDCAEGFLGELDEALWLLDEIEEADENAFAHAARKADHVAEFRRVLYRLHLVLTDWEQSAQAG
ncbi:MAG: hypothetical protein JWN00_4392 [Actinomycetia bacterium]|nr:hypothetical protein [Actinomycetes bacterium]